MHHIASHYVQRKKRGKEKKNRKKKKKKEQYHPVEQISADNVVEALSVQPVASVSVLIPDDKPTTCPYNALQKREEVCRPCRAATLCLAPTRARELQAVGLHVRRLVADSEEAAAMLWCTAGRRWRWRPCAALQRDPQPVVSVPITCATRSRSCQCHQVLVYEAFSYWCMRP